MKKILFPILLAFLFVSCSKESAYPLKTCVISGNELDSHGEPYVHKHEGRTVKFCCEPCVEDFNEDPAKYLAKLDAAKK